MYILSLKEKDIWEIDEKLMITKNGVKIISVTYRQNSGNASGIYKEILKAF